MSATLDSPSWSIADSPGTTDNTKVWDVMLKRLSVCETSDLDVDRSENVMTPHKTPNSICNDSESSIEAKSNQCTCNNNMSENDLKITNGVSCTCMDKNRENGEEGLVADEVDVEKIRRSKKRKSLKKKNERRSKEKDMCQLLTRINGENKSCGISSEHNLDTVGGDGEENRKERLQCRQHELNSSSIEINRPDVITSCDLTSNSANKLKSDDEFDQNKNEKKDCPRVRLSSCSTSQSTCSEGSYSRRKHHKHHKHKQKCKSPAPAEGNFLVSPKVNPIFLWVRQEDTRIVEVLCEDYDHRNRLRLTRTHHGWRAIPKTKCFSEAIIPKGKPKEVKNDISVGPKQLKRMKKKKRPKIKNLVRNPFVQDNPKIIKECSVALYRDDFDNYKSKNSAIESTEEEISVSKETENLPGLNPNFPKPLKSECDSDFNLLQSSFQKTVNKSVEYMKRTNKMVKSNSCDFPSLKKALESLPRSSSLDFKNKRSNVNGFKVQKKVRETVKSSECVNTSEEIILGVKNKLETEKNLVEKHLGNKEKKTIGENESNEPDNQRNHSDSIVMDMTKHDSDFNDADCDELGQLLKDIPDLEFVNEEELEEVDEDEEWSIPTDLTVPKSTTESSNSKVKLPFLPPNISSLVTVTSVKPSEPLTAPLPEVTITPIPNPKPAHQQKPQNNFLENLLSSRSVKSECDKNNIGQRLERRSSEPSQLDRKSSKHIHNNNIEDETKNKKMKVEDITLKNLLSKHQSGRTIKSLDLESCVQNLKMMDGEECPKSHLQELLSLNVSSDPISQLKEVLSNPHLAVPDPLLVPRARLPALVASPASEIPRLLSMHLEKTVEETPCPPFTDSDFLEVSLSNLHSLLSCSPEKLKSANPQDLANYQKSLETFLEWQRYQTELMEAQIKNSKSVPPVFPSDISNVAAATAFSQMLWLPYLNQLDLNCNTNRDLMSFMNSFLSYDYQTSSTNLTSPPQINISQVPQPSPFLTPTSPMEIESHLKTLAMWQEAVMMQQNSQSSRGCSKTFSTPAQQDIQRGNKLPNIPHHSTLKKQCSGQQNVRVPNASARGEALQNGHLGFEIYQDMSQNDYQRKQNRQNRFQQRLEEQQKQLELHQKYKQEQQNQFRKMQRSYSNYQAELLRQCKLNEKRKPGPVPGSISVKPLSNLIDKNNLPPQNKNSWDKFEDIKSSNFVDQAALKLQEFNTYIQRNKPKEEKPIDWQVHGLKVRPPNVEQQNSTDIRGSSIDTPKLKVKNLVDPNMSPPKLLKQIAPEHLPVEVDESVPVQEDTQTHLWHPLFGSNQIKPHPYNSPWRWTTVTVNGE